MEYRVIQWHSKLSSCIQNLSAHLNTWLRFSLCHQNLAPRKDQDVDGWMDGCIDDGVWVCEEEGSSSVDREGKSSKERDGTRAAERAPQSQRRSSKWLTLDWFNACQNVKIYACTKKTVTWIPLASQPRPLSPRPPPCFSVTDSRTRKSLCRSQNNYKW